MKYCFSHSGRDFDESIGATLFVKCEVTVQATTSNQLVLFSTKTGNREMARLALIICWTI